MEIHNLSTQTSYLVKSNQTQNFESLLRCNFRLER
jgi:hypothetical protein